MLLHLHVSAEVCSIKLPVMVTVNYIHGDVWKSNINICMLSTPSRGASLPHELEIGLRKNNCANHMM